ncbi:NUDIX domain-containing protein [Paenibacillus sp. MMS20-IR301]|uniref:NUDIX hydrolase n=1 Tax=Paenibacillus sp. MMS20-IR301 TaxID=2895946 RepID=UPI0028E3000F|nr:NUDIX domain-containing protein [Paenibacillus sp. MMS20-IR301]WNS46364.1 NUDIX domain-containing protein [Paenibacillus sp. MMS20-IR301]
MPNKSQSIIVAVKGVILHQGRILLVRRTAADSAGAGSWECAGGKIEFGESLETALQREIQEETGLEVTAERILYAVTLLTAPGRQVVIITYLCRPLQQQLEVLLSEEHTDYRWCTISELYTLLPAQITADFTRHGIFKLEGLLP